MKTEKWIRINMSQAWDKERVWVADRNWPFRTLAGGYNLWATKDSWRAGSYLFMYDMCPAYCWDQQGQNRHVCDKPDVVNRSHRKNNYSFKIFPRFWLAKITRIIHHNQLLKTTFGRILCLTRKWRQKCSVLAVRHR